MLSLSNLSPTWNLWDENSAELQLQPIKKVEYFTWTSPFPFFLLNFILNRGKLVFILNDNSTVDITTLGFLVSYKKYGNIGKKIADYINVPFEM
jgi:hypothetical protein